MPTKTASRKPAPQQGQSLVRFIGASGEKRIQTVIRERIGAFQPHWVGLETLLLMRRDPQVAFGTAILRAPIVAMPYSVQGEDPKIVAFVEHVLSKHYRRLALAGSLAIPFGFQVVAKEWEAQDLVFTRSKEGSKEKETFSFPSAWTFKRFKSIDPRTLTLLVDAATDDWGGVEQRNSAAPEGKVRVGREGAVLWSYRQEDVWGALTGFPMYHQCYEPWYDKQALRIFTNRYFERKADPSKKGRAPESITVGGRKVDGLTHLTSLLLALKGGDDIVLPNERDNQGNYKFDLEYMMDDKRGDMFQQRLDACDLQILRGLLITDEAGTSQEMGGRARAEIHAQTLAGMLEANQVEWCEEVVNPQVVEPLVEANFGTDAARESGTRVIPGGLTPEQKDALKEVLLKLIDAEQAMMAGERVKIADMIDGARILESLGLPQRSAEELEEMRKKQEEMAKEQAAAAADLEDEEIDEAKERRIADDLEKKGVLKKGAKGEDDE